MKNEIPKSVTDFMEKIANLCGNEHEAWAENFKASFANTLETTVKVEPDETTFLLTGDIPAMWLRDSTAQMRPYLVLAKEDPNLRKLITGLVKRQFDFINKDPYANAFNEKANGAGHQSDHTNFNAQRDWVWERKYEIDSLCYPVQLAYLLYKNTGEIRQFDKNFHTGIRKIITVFKTELHHEHSPYQFTRDTERQEDTLTNDGNGSPLAYTGMTWSGFRPSDDACQYGYLVPSNMFAVVILGYIISLSKEVFHDTRLMQEAQDLRDTISQGLNDFAKIKNRDGQEIWAYDVDGLGNQAIMDDSNVPDLIAAPYLGFCDKNDTTYLNTRKMILSPENPYYYEGKFAKGLGSSHTPENYVWPIALAMEGLTTDDKLEKERILNTLVATDAGTHLMHEGFDVNDPSKFTREWFSWANMMFCELVMDYFDIRVEV